MTTIDPFQVAALTGRPVEGETVIDVHGHCAGWEEPGGPGPRAWPLSAGSLLASMQRVGAAHLVFSHFDALRATTPGNLAAAAADTEHIVRQAAGRLSAHLVLHPCFAAEVRAQLDALRSTAVYVGAKLHGELHDVRAGSDRIAPLLARCEELDLSVLLHVHPADTLDDIAGVATRYSRLRFILAHLWPRMPGAADAFRAHPNLFTDSSLSGSRPGAVEQMVATVGADRVLYGSDSSYLSMGGQFSKAASTALPVAVKRQIFAANPCAALPRLARKLSAQNRPSPPPTPVS
jgi:predicted TIM-barrel fold metal-dependent hydrolase